ncbi:ABC transporter permease [Candidatus Saccharibacteria bacterium]|nr:ABC transporter permease [Candidatus Saccharibacteria bacterium]
MNKFNVIINDTWVVTLRNLIKYKRVPRLIIFSTVQPLMILLLFNFVFGGALRLPPGIDKYIIFLLPGIMVQVVLFGSTQATIAMAEDLNQGIINRFKSLPMSRFAVVAGRAFTDLVRNAIVLSTMAILGFLIGFELGGTIWQALAAFGIVLLFSFSMSWVSTTIGLLAKDPESAQALGLIWVFPLAFASSIFVPTETMPDWLQLFADNQPVSRVASAARELTLGAGNYENVIPAILWSLAIMVVFATISNRLYKKA